MHFNHVKKHQTFITILLFSLFSIIIIIQVIFPERKLEYIFTALTGWIGLIIGFFFNQEFIEELKRELRVVKEQKEKIKTQAKKTIEQIIKAQQEKESIIEKNL